MAPTRIRLISGVASLLLLAVLLAFAYADARGDRFAIGLLALAAVAALGYGLVARSEASIGGCLAAAAIAYLIQLHANHEHLPLGTAIYAGGLLAAAELAHRSAADGTISVPVVSFGRWVAGVAVLAVTASVGTAVVVEILSSFHGRSPWLEPLGFLAILAIALLANHLRRLEPERRPS